MTVAALALWYLGRARAQVDGELRQLGPAMMSVAPSGTRTVLVNGQRLEVSVGTAEADVPALLERARAGCEETLDLETWARGATPHGASADPMFYWHDGSKGFVGCLGADGPAAWQRLAASGDLADVGGLRYLYGERVGARTRVIAVRTEGSFVLARLMPREGDAPGADVPGVPRPAHARRVLALRVEGEPYRAISYVGEGTAQDVRAFYVRELPSRGWRVVSRPGALAVQATSGPRFVAISPEDRGGACWTTIVESRGP